MAQTVESLTIEIKAQHAEFSAAMAKMQKELSTFAKSTETSLNSVESSFSRIGGAFKNMLSVAGGISLAGMFQSAVSHAEELVSQGISHNAELEQSRVAIAALLQGTTDLTNREGKRADATTAWRVNLQEAASIQKEIAAVSGKTAGTDQELQNVFSIALAYSRGQKASTDDILRFSMGMMNAGTLAGLKGDQIVKETRQILELNSMQGQQVLPQLGIRIGVLRDAKTHGDQIATLNKGLEVYNKLASQMENTWDGLKTTAQSYMALTSAGAFSQTFIGAKDVVAGFGAEQQRIVDLQDRSKAGSFSNELGGVGNFSAELTAEESNLRHMGAVAADVWTQMQVWTAQATNGMLEFSSAVTRSDGEFARWSATIASYFAGGDLRTAISWFGRALWDLGAMADDVAIIMISAFMRVPSAMYAAGAAILKLQNPLAAAAAAMVDSPTMINAVSSFETNMADMMTLHKEAQNTFKPIRMEDVDFRAAGDKDHPIQAMKDSLVYQRQVWSPTLERYKSVTMPWSGPEFTRSPKSLPTDVDKTAASAQKHHDTLIKNTQEQIAALTEKNKALDESLALNLTTAQAEAKAAGAAVASKTGSKELGEQLAKQTELHKNLQAAQSEQFKAQQALAVSSLAMPEMLAAINDELDNGTPWKQIEEKVKAIKETAAIVEKFKNAGKSPDATLAAYNQTTLNQQNLNRAQEGGSFFSSTRKGLLDETEALRTQIAVRREDILAGKSEADTQRDIALALEVLKLAQNDATASLDAGRIEELQSLIVEKQALDKQADDLQKQQQLAESISGQISGAFMEIPKNITNAFEIMRNTVMGILDSVAKEIMRRQVTEPLTKYINKWLGGILGTDQDKVIKANNVFVNGREVGGQGGPAGGTPGGPGGTKSGKWGASSTGWGLDNTGMFPGMVGGGSIDPYAQEELGSGKIDANSVTWSAMGGGSSDGASGASGGGMFGGIANFFSGITKTIGGIFSGLTKGISGIFGGLFGGGAAAGGGGFLSFLGFHSGGIVGSGSNFRSVHPSAFAGAPRFHNGMMPGEVAAILKDDEGVFTKDQMHAIGRGSGGRSITIVQNVSTPDVGGFRNSRDQLAADARVHADLAHRRFK